MVNPLKNPSSNAEANATVTRNSKAIQFNVRAILLCLFSIQGGCSGSNDGPLGPGDADTPLGPV
jgi:hypothetical protein